MARIRTVKPDFFRHEALQDLEAANPGKYPMLVFEGLWGHCDKAGRFEWRPRQLKLDILPFLPFDMADTLGILEQAGFIERYSAAGKEYGLVPTFGEHQRISGKEATEPEKHPAPNSEEVKKKPRKTRASAVTIPGSYGEAPEKHPGEQEGKGREGEGNGKTGAASRAAAPPVGNLVAQTPSAGTLELVPPPPLFLMRPDDYAKALFGPALEWLSGAISKPPDKLRSIMGLWLKDTGNDHERVFKLLADAELKQVADPRGWITAAIARTGADAAEYQRAEDELYRGLAK